MTELFGLEIPLPLVLAGPALVVLFVAIGAVPGLTGSSKPLARFHPGFGEGGLGFHLIVHVDSFVNQSLVQSALRERILANGPPVHPHGIGPA